MAKSSAYAIFLIAGILIGFLAGVLYAGTNGPVDRGGQVAVTCFSPAGNCSSVVVSWIERANKSVHVLMFTFTLETILDSLILAKGRGVEVLAVLEREQEANQQAYEILLAAGVEVRKDNNSGLMHSKFAVIDDLVVITGSYNWTKSADTINDENLLVIVSHQIAVAFDQEFGRVWEISS